MSENGEQAKEPPAAQADEENQKQEDPVAAVIQEPEQMSQKKIVSAIDQKLEEGAFMCCCCLCECRNKQTTGLTCCCILPIKCGVYMIGACILAVTLFCFLEIFYELLNDDIHWWYVLVGVVLCTFLVIASAFTIVFFTVDDHKNRTKLWTACLFVIFGVSSLAIWCAVYFLFWYKKDAVVVGNDGVGFIKSTRKQQIVITIYVACLIDAVFAYFLCIVSSYQKAMKKPGDEDEEEDKGEKTEETAPLIKKEQPKEEPVKKEEEGPKNEEEGPKNEEGGENKDGGE